MTSARPDGRRARRRAVGRDDRESRRLPAAGVPKRPAGVGFLGMVFALATAVLGALGVYDGMVLLGLADADPLLTPVLTGSVALDEGIPTAALAAIAVLLGVWLLWLALKPGRRSGVEVGAGTGVWMTHGDVERLVAEAATQCDGVLSARADASRRRVRVHVQTTGRDVEGDVHTAVSNRLASLSAPPRVVVRAHPTHTGGAR